MPDARSHASGSSIGKARSQTQSWRRSYSLAMWPGPSCAMQRPSSFARRFGRRSMDRCSRSMPGPARGSARKESSSSGRTHEMYAIAEVYETDVRRIKVGQRARVSSPALEAPIEGVVERVGMKIGKLDALSTDPAARTDARVVEVEIRLDDSEPVKGLTNLQVEIAIAP